MPAFSQLSKDRLSTCHPDLIKLFNEVVTVIDCEVTEGHRDQANQEADFAKGVSKLHYPFGKHNAIPSNAVDVYILPVEMNSVPRFFWFAGYVIAVADKMFAQGRMTHHIRWGGAWDRDYQLTDEKGLRDLVHFEIIA